jgi:hypothetical protein
MTVMASSFTVAGCWTGVTLMRRRCGPSELIGAINDSHPAGRSCSAGAPGVRPSRTATAVRSSGQPDLPVPRAALRAGWAPMAALDRQAARSGDSVPATASGTAGRPEAHCVSSEGREVARRSWRRHPFSRCSLREWGRGTAHEAASSVAISAAQERPRPPRASSGVGPDHDRRPSRPSLTGMISG